MDERELLRAGRDRWRKEGCLIYLAEDKPAVFIGHPRDREATERECTGGGYHRIFRRNGEASSVE